MSDLSEEVLKQLDELDYHLEQGDLPFVRRQCERIKAIIGDHPRLSDLLREIAEREALLAVGVSPPPRVHVLRCPRCHLSLHPRGPDTALISCPSCSSPVDISGDEAVLVEEGIQVKRPRHEPIGALRLGMVGRFGGKLFEICGRIRYASVIREWDEEDHLYTVDTWSYDEWILVGEGKEYLFIEEDEEGYFGYEKITPNLPQAPPQSGGYISLFKEHPEQLIGEMGTTRIVYLEGEFSWLPRCGQRSRYAEYSFDGKRYSIEASLSGEEGNEEIGEVEFFEGTPLSLLEIATAFSLRDTLAEEESRIERVGELRGWSWLFFLSSLFLLLLLTSSLASSPEVIAGGSQRLENLGPGGMILGPFELSRKGEIYRMKLAIDIPDNSGAYGQVELLDEDKAPLATVEGDFWRESGYEDGERWSESETDASLLFKLEEPGRYYARLSSELERPVSGKLHYTVYRGESLSRYYLLGLILTLLYAISLRRSSSPNPVYIITALAAGIAAVVLFIQEHSED